MRADEGPRGYDRFGGAGLEDGWRLLKRHLTLILIIVCGAVAVTFVVVQSLVPQYRAFSTMILTSIGTRIDATETELETYELNNTVVETELDVLGSRGFAAEVVRVKSLDVNSGFQELMMANAGASTESQQELMIDLMLASYSAHRQGESMAIEIVATATDPELATDIANTVAEVYIARTTAARQKSIVDSIAFLRNRVESLGEELSRSELELAVFIRDNELDNINLPNRLRAEVDRLTAILGSIKNGSSNAEDIKRVESELADAEAALQDRTRSELQLLRRERSMDLFRLRYQTAIEKLNELETQLQLVGTGAEQVSVARVPVKPYWPNTAATMIVGALGGVVLAMMAVMLIENLNTRVMSEEQLARESGLPSFGVLPRVKGQDSPRNKTSPIPLILENSRSPFVESLRSFLTLLFNLGGEGKVVMITSGLPYEGKSTISVSIATVAAQDGLKVLVLDFDSHRRGASRMLQSDSEPVELEKIKAERIEPKQVVIDGEPLEGVYLLSVQARPKMPPMAVKEALTDLNAAVRTHFDLVIVDTPPVLVVDDACRFGPLVDNTLLVVKWGTTTVEALRDAVQTLSRAGIAVTATVFNDVDVRKGRKYGYGGYTHYYGYSDTSET